MRYLIPLLIVFGVRIPAAELSAGTYPLWDTVESPVEYARRANLPAMKTLDLGNGVKLELNLIPAGRFVMGSPEPESTSETTSPGYVFLGLGASLTLGLLVVIFSRKLRNRETFKFSLRWLLTLVFGLSVALYGGVRAHKAAQAYKQFLSARTKFEAAFLGEKPAHTVTLTHPFYFGKFTVTQEQYKRVMADNPSNFLDRDNPVENVTWPQTQEFCKKLSDASGVTVRLPTEAEWEYACRAGTQTEYWSGDSESDLGRVAWYAGNSQDTSHPVGKKPANAFGLYDMHGNVFQWCHDLYAEDYALSPPEDPQGPDAGDGHGRVIRGGGWICPADTCRSAFRYASRNRGPSLGFRVVVEVR